MPEGTPRLRAVRTFLAWGGLIVMAVSIVWLESLVPEQAPQTTRRVGQTFSVVVLDPGHGGQDSGAMCGTMLEKDLTFDVARRLDRQLQAKGLNTLMTRIGDGYVSLAERAALTNRVPDCVFVSIHFNEGNKEGTSTGIETYYADHQVTPGAPVIPWLPFLERAASQAPNFESQSLAGFIQEALVAHTQAMNRGTKPQQYYVIANVRHPAVLIEGGFINNKEELAKLENEQYREQLAAAICDGVVRYRDLVQERRSQLATATGGNGGE
ncbi:MAG: N-acetylmuramoyl-L-alanine amidase [Verrucomicrobiota bacterium]|jgi:N-acetylmuramoyl-L-alanine amidase